MKGIWNSLETKGRIEVLVHLVVAVFILGTVWRGYSQLSEKVKEIGDKQQTITSRVDSLDSTTQDIKFLKSRLERIMENQKEQRKLLIDFIRSQKSDSGGN